MEDNRAQPNHGTMDTTGAKIPYKETMELEAFPDVLDDAYFISTVAQVHNTIIKCENISIGFCNIMKMAVM